MAWVSWTTLYNNWLDALAEREIERFFQSGHENSRQMRVMYTKLGNVVEFTKYLKSMADQETLGVADGEIPSAIGGH